MISWKTEYCFNASSVPGPINASIGNWWKTVVWGVRFKLLFSSIFSFFCLILLIVVFLIIFFFVLFWHLSLGTQILFVFLLSSLEFYCSSFTQFGCSILLWLGFFLSWSSFLGYCFFFFSIANYYSWVVKDWDFLDKKDINGNERLGFSFPKKIWWKTSSKKDLLRRVYGDSYISFEDKSYLLHRSLNRKTWFLQRKTHWKTLMIFFWKKDLVCWKTCFEVRW